MSLYHKVIEHLKTKVVSKNVDWQRIDRTAQEVKESMHAYYERLLKAFKNYSGTETIEAKDMLHFVFRFVEGLRPEISQMIKMHLICWQSKSIDEVLNYAKYCSDEIETKQKRLKEKVTVMQLRAAQTGLQGLQGFQQQLPQQQQQGNAMFQPQMRGRGRGGFVNNGPGLNTIMIPNGIQAMKQTNSDEEEEDSLGGDEVETVDEEYPLITLYPMLTEADIPAELQETVEREVWDMTGKEVGLVKGVEPVKVTVKPNKDALDEIVLKRDEMDAFIELKECMCRAPALGMPDYTKPFTLFCHDRDACSLSVLTQTHGGVNRLVAYFSASLDPVAAALPGCLRAVAAVGIRLNQSEGIVMGHPLKVMVPHSVKILLTRSRTQHMTDARLTRYETIILGSLNVQLKRCTTLNPATLFPSENVEIENAEDIEHDCLQVTEFCTKPRPDIKDTRLEENNQVIFVDGSCLRDALGILKAGYAVCTITGVLEASWLQGVYSAQVAELVALTRACQLSALMKVTIHTDSQYGFGIVHDFGQLWSQRGFVTSSGSPVKNGERIRELLHAIQLPGEVAVVKCSAHSKSQDYGGHSDRGGRQSAPAMRSPPNGRSAVRRPRMPFCLSRWAGGRPPAQRERPCNEEAGSEWSRRSCRGATGAVAPVAIFTVCKADSENHHGALLGGPCTAHASGMGSAGAPRGPTTPVPAILFLPVRTARNRVAGRGSESPWRRCKQRRAWRIPWARVKTAGNRRFPFSDRGFTAAVRMALEAPPACCRCFRGPRPWRSWTARVGMTPYVSLGNGYADQVARFCALNCILLRDEWNLINEPELEPSEAFALKVVDTIDELKSL
ncbi:hypothetical protein NDU88_010353 [Pleurodeles waltl]|uniref:RNase H type-1 domain-containing protein n=1 Tax=Pleurodeles waltl TaxID=8319 RepID=A0AAV7RY07_PLEWA|nr:hypothetical protein NDU88_010353 [Pleurodeles waltl]